MDSRLFCQAGSGCGKLFVKKLLIMKLTAVLILAFTLNLSAKSFSQKVSIHEKNVPVQTIFKIIEKQTNHSFIYEKSALAKLKRVTINVSDAKIEEVLNICLQKHPFEFEIKHKTIIIREKSNFGDVVEPDVKLAVQFRITGVITNEEGVPLDGASIKLKSNDKGTTTDVNGNFSLDIPGERDVIVVSFVGYQSTEIQVSRENSVVLIALKANEGQAEEVVIIGYGTQRKKDLTGAVAQVSSEELQAVPVFNVGQALQGRASGVAVSHNSGAPGSRVQVRIRGGNSMIGSNEPLYVVDGFPVSGGIEFINPADIETIDILKDASATAIYGARGANGVVMVTTKRGKKGGSQSNITINSYYGVQETAKRFDLLDARQYAIVANEFLQNDGKAPEFDVDQISGPGTDWQGAIFQSAPINNHTLSFSGSGGKTNYSLSGNYYGQGGIIMNSGVQRGTFRLNVDHEVKSWLNLAVSLNASRREIQSVPVDNGQRGSNVLSGALSAPPTASIYDDEGLPVRIGEAHSFTDPGDMRNPMLWKKPYKNSSLSNNVLLNNALTFKLTSDLTFTTRIGLEYENTFNDVFTPVIYRNDRGGASSGNSYRNSFLNENVLNYSKRFTSSRLDVTGGFTYQTFMNRSSGISVSGFSNNITESYNLGSAETINPPTSGISEWQLVSGLGRVNYSLLDKYFVTASLRSDGSSRFGKDNKWGVFPSTAVAWTVSEENFMRDNASFISNLKLRASYGITGNTALSPYQSLDRMSPVKYIYGGSAESVGYAPSGISNSQLKWETSSEFDIGFDLGVFDNRIGLTFDYYKKNTKDLLASVPLPSSMGFSFILQNFGEIQNQGFEFALNADILTQDFKWDVSAQLSMNRNKVMKIAGGSDIVTAGQTSGLPGYNIARVGEPLGAFFGYLEDGLDENGQIKFVDVNRDGVVTPLDRVILGNPYPDFEFGLNSNFSYKNFKLNIFLQGVKGNDIFFATAFTNLNSFQRTQNQFADLFGNYWTASNPDPNAKYPKLSSLTQMRPSDRFIKDGTYLRVKSVQLSYNLAVNKLKINWLQSASIYLRANNLFTFTNYMGLDPEVNTRGSDAQSIESRLFVGTDESGYPNARIFGAGIDIRF